MPVQRGRRATAVVMSLGTGERRTVDLGPGRTWHAELSESEQWIRAMVVRRDTNGDGKLELPRVSTDLGKDPCYHPGTYGMFGLAEGQDQPDLVVAPVAGGSARPAEERALFFGPDLVRRSEGKPIAIENAAGGVRYRLPAECRGPVYAANAAKDSLLVGCTSQSGVQVWWFSGGKGKWLGQYGEPTIEARVETEGDWVEVGGWLDRVVNLGSGRLVSLPKETSLCEVRGTTVLAAQRNGGTLSVDLATGKSSEVSRQQCAYHDSRAAGPYTLLGNDLFDWNRGRVTKRFATKCKDRASCFGSRYLEMLGTDGRVLLGPVPCREWKEVVKGGMAKTDPALREFLWVEGRAIPDRG